jgi:molybdopterin-guanine dinucleotide biosynthesis protein A
MENICFSILSGGKNSRIGTNKAFLNISGTTIIERIVTIAKYFPQNMIITNDPEAYKTFDIQIFTDIYPNRGPISGIHSSLKHTDLDNVFVISCDMPFITLETVKYIISHHHNADITLPIINDKTYFVCAVYSKNIFKKLDSYLSNGAKLPEEKNRYFALYQMKKMFKINKIILDKSIIDKNEFININTIEDWEKVKSLC